MAINGVQIIYRLRDFVRLLIDYRGGVTPPDTFNLYWSTTSGGAYTLFLSKILNEPNTNPAVKGKVIADFIPSTITNPVQWDNIQTNYIKLAPVTGGVVGAQEGPLAIPTRNEMLFPIIRTASYGFNKNLQQFIPIAVNDEGKIITA